MPYDPARHHRRSIRLRGYDYAQAGAYFITLVTQDRARLFGRVTGGAMALSEAGRIAEQEWLRTPLVRPNLDLDAFVVMPDHMHMILVIERRAERAGQPQHGAFRSPSETVGAIVRGFKGAVVRQIRALQAAPELKVWQRDYYERIIRDEAALHNIRRYIGQNPARWQEKHGE